MPKELPGYISAGKVSGLIKWVCHLGKKSLQKSLGLLGTHLIYLISNLIYAHLIYVLSDVSDDQCLSSSPVSHVLALVTHCVNGLLCCLGCTENAVKLAIVSFVYTLNHAFLSPYSLYSLSLAFLFSHNLYLQFPFLYSLKHLSAFKRLTFLFAASFYSLHLKISGNDFSCVTSNLTFSIVPFSFLSL